MANEGTKEKLDIELEAPADFTSPEVLYQDLINTIRKYHPSDDITMIEKAYRIADEAHKEQKRKSGEPYIIHPLCVAIILADLEMDKELSLIHISHVHGRRCWLPVEPYPGHVSDFHCTVADCVLLCTGFFY